MLMLNPAPSPSRVRKRDPNFFRTVFYHVNAFSVADSRRTVRFAWQERTNEQIRRPVGDGVGPLSHSLPFSKVKLLEKPLQRYIPNDIISNLLISA